MEPVTEELQLNDQGFDAAVQAVEEGRCIVLPTDTVYGIGADPFSAEAVQGLLDAKERGQDMPPPVLIAERLMMRALVSSVPDDAQALAKEFWPGPLTLILGAQKAVGLHLGETRDTVAVRVPDHDGTRELLRRTGPLAVSSANISGSPASTDVAGAREQLGERVAVYLDGGPTPGAEPSTIVDFASDTDGVVLRLGVLSLEQLQAVVPSVRLHEPEDPEPSEETLEGEGTEGDDVPADAEAPTDAELEADAPADA